MTGWALGLSIVGAITGAIGTASGVYSFILSGYRVKISLGFAIRMKNGDHIEFDPDWSGDFSEHDDLALDSKSLQILVLARNSGRSKIEVRQLVIQNYRKKAKNDEHLYFLIPGPPFEGAKMPHLLDFGSSCSWLIPLEDVKVLSSNIVQGEVVRTSIFAEIRLADGKSALTRGKGLTPAQVDRLQERWESFRNKKI